jgi:hypothetical protein
MLLANMRLRSPSSGVKCPMPVPRSAPSSDHHSITDLSPSVPASSQHHSNQLTTPRCQISGSRSRSAHKGLSGYREILLAARTTRLQHLSFIENPIHMTPPASCSQPSAHAQITPSQICPSADMGQTRGAISLWKCHCAALVKRVEIKSPGQQITFCVGCSLFGRCDNNQDVQRWKEPSRLLFTHRFQDKTGSACLLQVKVLGMRGCTPDSNALQPRYYLRLRFGGGAARSMSRIYASRFDGNIIG